MGLIVSLVLWSAWTTENRRSNGLVVTIKNDSNVPLNGLILKIDEKLSSVPTVFSGHSMEVRPVQSEGENSLSLVTSDGQEYMLVGYFEGKLVGNVRVKVVDVIHSTLYGMIESDTHYPGTDGSRQLQKNSFKAP